MRDSFIRNVFMKKSAESVRAIVLPSRAMLSSKENFVPSLGVDAVKFAWKLHDAIELVCCQKSGVSHRKYVWVRSPYFATVSKCMDWMELNRHLNKSAPAQLKSVPNSGKHGRDQKRNRDSESSW